MVRSTSSVQCALVRLSPGDRTWSYVARPRELLVHVIVQPQFMSLGVSSKHMAAKLGEAPVPVCRPLHRVQILNAWMDRAPDDSESQDMVAQMSRPIPTLGNTKPCM